ncbi:MAG: VWA domain-containing protein [Filomicrobium sp.]
MLAHLRHLGVIRFWVAWLVVFLVSASHASANGRPACTDDAMIVFDASGSMSGMLRTGVRESRIDRVRKALEIVLPQIESHRRLGLIVYGPEYDVNYQAEAQCENINLRFSPMPRAAQRIIKEVNELVPAGVTPLTDAITQAAEALNYRDSPAEIVLFTDGQETCGGVPCSRVGELLRQSKALRIHVINYAIRDPYGIRAPFRASCVASRTGGTYVPVETLDELVQAFRKVLGCPLLTELDK